MKSPFTHVLLAIGPEHLEKLFKETLLIGNRDYGGEFEIIKTVARERQFLDEIIQIEQPEMVILHEKLPHSFNINTAAGKEQNEQDILSLLENWRINFPNMRVVYVCERERSDPFLGDLVARNVLDIFYERSINQEILVKQLIEPPAYQNVKKIRVGKVELEQETEEQEELPTVEEVTTPAASIFSKMKESVGSFKKARKEKDEKPVPAAPAPLPIEEPPKQEESTKEEPKKEAIPEVVEEAVEQTTEEPEVKQEEVKPPPTESPPVKSKSFFKNPFANKGEKKKEKKLSFPGTVTISVSSLLMQGGSTQLALALAYLLSHDSKSEVAVVEANISADFNRIHALHEGEDPKSLAHIHEFQLEDLERITFYKWHSLLDIRSLQSRYSYIIIDGGMYSHCRYTADLDGSHIRFMLTSAMEWKDHLIESFANERIRQRKTVGAEDFIYGVSQTDDTRIKDISKRFKGNYTFANIPNIPFPFELDKETVQHLKELLTSNL